MDSTNFNLDSSSAGNDVFSNAKAASSVLHPEFFENDSIADASYVTIGVASPETIRSWSKGEVKNPETINYRTFKPEKGGLFCERIFGPTKDWECACGRYKRIKFKGVVCESCGVEVTQARVRRERMGHLDLAVPVSHIWFYKISPSSIGVLLDIPPLTLQRVIYYEGWIVVDKGDTPLKVRQFLSEEEYQDNLKQYGNAFVAGMGAEAIEQLLGQLDLPKLREELLEELTHISSVMVRGKITRRIRLIEGFINSGRDPRWMILRVLPVLPPELRPLVPLEGGRFATSDLNDLYRRVINRNNRLKSLQQLHTPEVIIRNEKRMLQEAVDALLDNGREGKAVTGTGNRELKSLSDMLKGKQGRFRQNLLGKRVDYSGRSVIVVGPELKINQCGLPKEMAMVLFEPFIIRKLKERGYVSTVKNAKKWIEQRKKVVWDILDEVTKGHPVMLNRAPTLHRLSIQAFDPVLIEGQAIRLHPLVCTAFNADFDGDQMAVHVPLSNEAQLEAKLLMLSPNNIFSPASGKPVTTPSQDICLGVYFLCYENKKKHAAFDKTPRQEQFWFNDITEALRALQEHRIGYHDFFNIRNPFYQKDTVWGQKTKNDKFLVTTVGRCIFNEIWPPEMGFRNEGTTKKQLGTLISECYDHLSRAKVIEVLDSIKSLGYEYATWAGFSIGLQDMIVPDEKAKVLAESQKEVDKIRSERRKGVITELERYNKCVEVWRKTNETLADMLVKALEENLDREEINPIYAMLDSGARGSRDQVRQLAGMRGLMAKPNGSIIEEPIKANFREGLTVLEYFISSHGARKGLADTALKTADSGYMTRRLVDVAHDVICVEDDCGTVNGIWVKPVKLDEDEKKKKNELNDRIVGRFSVDEVIHPVTGEVIVGVNEEITLDIAKKIAAAGIEEVHIRSVLTCESVHGICAKCYGRNLATGAMPLHGDPLGIIAAQSIGEPGTQLTMRTFHVGGTASATSNASYYEAQHNGRLRLEFQPVKTEDGKYVVIAKKGKVVIEDEDGVELESYELQQGATLDKTTGEMIEAGERFVEWDPWNESIVTRTAGEVEYQDLVDGVTYKLERNETSGNEELIVMEVHREDIHPTVKVIPDDYRKFEKWLSTQPKSSKKEESFVFSISNDCKKTKTTKRSSKKVVSGSGKGFVKLDFIPWQTHDKEYFMLDREQGEVTIVDEKGAVLQKITLEYGARLLKLDGDAIQEGEEIAVSSGAYLPDGVSFVAEQDGTVECFTQKGHKRCAFKDNLVSNVADKLVLVFTPACEKRNAQSRKLLLMAPYMHVKRTGEQVKQGAVMVEVRVPTCESIALPENAHILVQDKSTVRVGELVARKPRQSTMTRDITGGLPRVAELFEARRPKRAAEIADIDGIVELDHAQGKGGSTIRITDLESDTYKDHKIPVGKQIIVNDGDSVKKGEPLTDGDVVLSDMLAVCGPQEAQAHLVNEVQRVYKSQGVEINDKHIEIIVRQMMRRVHIADAGDTMFLGTEYVDRRVFEEENNRVSSEGGKQAVATPHLEGITKAALATESFISAASFQNTTRILTEAATLGRTDYLHGFKENVIMGHLIPAGTGYKDAQNVKLEYAAGCDPFDSDAAGEKNEGQKSKEKDDTAKIFGL